MKWFATSLRRDPDDPRGLLDRIDDQVQERIEEALDFFLLDLLVHLHRVQGRPVPVEGSARDRREFEALARAFLMTLEAKCDPGPDDPKAAQGRRPLDLEALVSRQVHQARALPDYWQRLDRAKERFRTARLEAAARPSLFRRLFGR